MNRHKLFTVTTATTVMLSLSSTIVVNAETPLDLPKLEVENSRTILETHTIYSYEEAIQYALNQLNKMDREPISVDVKFNFSSEEEFRAQYQKFMSDIQTALINNHAGNYSDVIFKSLASENGVIDTKLETVQPSNGTTATLRYTFKYEYRTTAEQDTYVENEVQNIISKLDVSESTDFEKIVAVNKYISANFEYTDLNTYSSITNPEIHTVYGMLTKGHGVCQAYAGLAYLLLQKLGVEVKYQTGYINASNEYHAWNLVNVDNQWYNFDPTHNDPVGNIGNQISYKYLLVSDEVMKQTRTRDHLKLAKAISTKYDYISTTTNTTFDLNGNQAFVSYSPQNTALEYYDVYTFNVDRPKEKTKILDDKGNPVQAYYLFYEKGKLYFIDANDKKIKVWNPVTKQIIAIDNSITVDNGGFIPKMYVKDGNLYYHSSRNIYSSIPFTPIESPEEAQAAATVVNEGMGAIDIESTTFVNDFEEIQELYAQLTEQAKGYVDNEKLETLKSAYDLVKIKAEALIVSNSISQFKPFTFEFGTQFDQLVTAYDKLSPEAKALVSNDKVLKNFEDLREQWTKNPLLWKDGKFENFGVKPNKEWKVTFNEAIDSSSINLENVKVYDEQGNQVSLALNTDETNTVLSISLEQGKAYEVGESYLLVIDSDFLNEDGKTTLNKDVMMRFTVGN